MRPIENGAEHAKKPITDVLTSAESEYITNTFKLVQDLASLHGISIYGDGNVTKDGFTGLTYTPEQIQAFALELELNEAWNAAQFLKLANHIDTLNYFMLDLQNLPFIDESGNTTLKPTYVLLTHKGKTDVKPELEQHIVPIGCEIDITLRRLQQNAEMPITLYSLPSGVIHIIQDVYNIPNYGQLDTSLFFALYLIANIIALVSPYFKKPANTKLTVTHFPSSPMIDLVHRAVRYADNYKRLEERAAYNETITVTETRNNTTIIRTKGQNNIAKLQLSRTVNGKLAAGGQLLQQGSDTYEKILNLVLLKIEQDCLYSHTITDYHVYFSLQDLVNYGLYKSIESARIGIDGCFHNFLKQFFVAGSLTIGQGKGAKTYANTSTKVLFTGYDTKQNVVIIDLNKDIDWNFIAPFHTLLPEHVYFRLPIRPSRLFCEIFKMARQNTDKLKKDGSFIITFETIREWLALPDNNQTKNPGRDIKKPISDAVRDITETWHNEYPQEQTPGLTLELQCDETLKISEYMKAGRLKVTLAGQYLDYFISLQDTKTAKIEEKQKKLAALKDAEKAPTKKTKTT